MNAPYVLKQGSRIQEYIIQNTEYCEDSEYDQDIRSVFINHKSVCHGYSCAFLYLCERVGIPCGMVSGDIVDRDTHTWNFVELNDQYYWVDTTWADNVNYQPEDLEKEAFDYDFLCCTDEPFMSNRILFTDEKSSLFEEGVVFEYPNCTDDSLNYYVCNGKYLDKYDSTALRDNMAKQIGEGNDPYVTVKFSSHEDMDNAISDLFSESRWVLVLKQVREEYGVDIDPFSGEWHTSDSYNRLTVYFPR